MSELTPLKEFMGWRISVDTGTGQFVGRKITDRGVGQVIRRKDLRALEREIASRSTGRVELMDFSRPTIYTLTIPKVPDKLVVVSLQGQFEARSESGNLMQLRPSMALYDQGIIDTLQEFNNREKEFRVKLMAEYRVWAAGVQFTPVPRAKLEELLASSTAKTGDAV